MAFTLPPLPYAKEALAPHISASTLDFHHGKHHKAYVDKLNKLIEDKKDFQKLNLEDVIQAAWESKEQEIFNNAAQTWNHTFYWNSMTPKGGGRPTGDIAAAIEKDFGSFEVFAKEFKTAGETQFGSGWAWLTLSGGKLKVLKTPDAQLPMVKNQKALLTMDVWEHAYYLDYQSKRPDYVKAWLENLANWAFANENLG